MSQNTTLYTTEEGGEKKNENQEKLPLLGDEPKKKNSGGRVFIGIIIIVLVLVAIARNRNGDKNNEIVLDTNMKNDEETTLPALENKEDLLRANLITNFSNTVAEGKPTNTFDKKLAIKGKIKSGFLYIKTNVNGKPVESPDTTYLNLTSRVEPGKYEAFGGHLNPSQSLSESEENTATELLFNLKDVVSREYYSDKENRKTDWIEVLNNYEDQRLIGFISSLGNGTIEEASIYYECAEESNCNVSLK